MNIFQRLVQIWSVCLCISNMNYSPEPFFCTPAHAAPRSGLGSGHHPRAGLVGRCRKAFCKVTAPNPQLIGISITKPVSRARGLSSPSSCSALWGSASLDSARPRTTAGSRPQSLVIPRGPRTSTKCLLRPTGWHGDGNRDRNGDGDRDSVWHPHLARWTKRAAASA